MLILILIFIAFISFGIFVANNAPGEFLKLYKTYKRINIENQLCVIDFVESLQQDSKFYSINYAITQKELQDSYYYKNNTVYISDQTAYGYDVASFAIISHELGHAEQNLEGGTLYKSSILLRKISRSFGWLALPLCITGAILLFLLGLQSVEAWIIFSLGAVGLLTILVSSFFVTIIEFDASKRAISLLSKKKILNSQELKRAKKFLKHAGYTYLGNFFSFLLSWTFLVPKAKII